MRAALFVAIIAAAIALAFLGLQVLRVTPLLLGAALLLVAVILFLSPQLVEFKEFERGVRFRLGKFKDVVGPGWVIVFPSFDRIERVELRDHIVDVPPQKVITKDNVNITIDALTYVRVIDPRKAIIEIRDYHKAISGFMVAEIRNIVSKLELEGVLEKTEDINVLLRQRLQEISERWGVTATRVEVEHITLPPELVEAMTQRQSAEERKRRIKLESEAKQITIDALNESASKVSDTTMTYLYLDTLRSMGAGSATKIIFPLELTSLANWLAARLNFGTTPPASPLKPAKGAG